MPEEENIDIIDEESASEDDSEEEDLPEEDFTDEFSLPDELIKPEKKPRHYRAPLIIAGVILAVSILFFAGWKCFFDTSIYGCWGIAVKSADGTGTNEYTLTFSEDGTVRYHRGGYTQLGRYELSEKDGAEIVSLYINTGYNVVANNFEFTVDGNHMTGRHLRLTDMSGMFIPAASQSADEETLSSNKSLAEEIRRDDLIYYQLDFTPMSEKDPVTKYENTQTDDALIGSWIVEYDDPSYNYTMTFNSDGTFSQLSYFNEITGSYTVSDGKIIVKIIYDPGKESTGEIPYSINGDTLTLGESEFKKAEGPYDYKKNADAK